MASQQSSASAADALVLFGKSADIAAVRRLLPQLDTAPGEVVVRGWVYEVSNTDAKNTAFSIAAHVLDGQLGVSNRSTSADANSLTFDAHFLSAAVSALAAMVTWWRLVGWCRTRIRFRRVAKGSCRTFSMGSPARRRALRFC
jgi:type II secretory pathway component GspD/PulD (secretin)